MIPFRCLSRNRVDVSNLSICLRFNSGESRSAGADLIAELIDIEVGGGPWIEWLPFRLASFSLFALFSARLALPAHGVVTRGGARVIQFRRKGYISRTGLVFVAAGRPGGLVIST